MQLKIAFRGQLALAILSLAATLLFCLKPQIAAASECSEVKLHIDLARRSVQEADAYKDENDDSLARANVKNADHEADVATAETGWASCLSTSEGLAFDALIIHNNYYKFIYREILADPAYVKESMSNWRGTINDDKETINHDLNMAPSANPKAIAEMQRWSKRLQRLYAIEPKNDAALPAQ
jgi:hypothetical protein